MRPNGFLINLVLYRLERHPLEIQTLPVFGSASKTIWMRKVLELGRAYCNQKRRLLGLGYKTA